MLTSMVDFKDFSSTLSLVTVFLFFTFFWTPAKALPVQPQVIGSLQPITSAPGDDVILPCHLEPQFNVEGLTVEWSKPDLKPDPSDRLSRVEYVHLYRDRREVTDMKLPSYVSRTSLFTDDLKHGNISLKISNVTLADTGRYRCFIPKLRSRVKQAIVELVVDPNYVKMGTTETELRLTDLQTPGPNKEMDLMGRPSRSHLIPIVLVCIVLILSGGACGYLLKHNFQGTKSLMKSAAVPNAG
ncbi:myelin-oligodendrocyte glycoprotein-like [Anabas testudineus]|uniref:Ig-like domain-containing protein n=1 Tax=Anabas testudineus TaxID=64144 RepID=A0A3Q1IEJ7_ANATE|nr:myelin-oligodendrocyte glycoprotein-like [Anabas testudineus]